MDNKNTVQAKKTKIRSEKGLLTKAREIIAESSLPTSLNSKAINYANNSNGLIELTKKQVNNSQTLFSTTSKTIIGTKKGFARKAIENTTNHSTSLQKQYKNPKIRLIKDKIELHPQKRQSSK
ncbi:MAG: hypothetical protein IKJ76_00065 [Fibrobacter sp.]|nr:hypothetical protein [Fibrobacter sp.]